METKEWREFAATRLKVIAKHNSYIVSDMLIADLERHGKGLDNYSVLGVVFTQAAKDGIIEKQQTAQKSKTIKTVWLSKIYRKVLECSNCGKRTMADEAHQRNFNTDKCAHCGGNLKGVES